MLFIRANTHFNICTIPVIQYLTIHTTVFLHLPACTPALVALSSFGWCTIYVPTTPLPSTSHLISKGPLTFMGLCHTCDSSTLRIRVRPDAHTCDSSTPRIRIGPNVGLNTS